MNTLTPRQYLVEISVKSLTCEPSSQISKAICQLHYGQHYIKFKTHPQIGPNGIANFKKQTICIPFSDQLALVFKKNISSKKQIFLGHYQIQIQEYLQRKIYFIQLNQKLYETQSFVNFQCKIIDKQRFAESQTQDLSEQQSAIQKSQYSVFDDEPTNVRRHTIRESQSQYKGGRRSPRQNQSPNQQRQQRQTQKFQRQQYSPLLPQQFNKKLYFVQQIIKKKNMFHNQFEKLSLFSRNQRGELRSDKIQKLQKLLKAKKQEELFNTLMISILLGLVSLFLGIVITI